MDSLKVLLVEDDPLQRKFIEKLFEKIETPRFNLYSSEDANSALLIIKEKSIDLVISDYMMPGVNGMELLKKIRAISPHIDVVILTAQTDIQVAVKLIQNGAMDYLPKPLSIPILHKLLLTVKEKGLLLRENRLLRERLEEKHNFRSIISHSGVMEEVLNTAWRVADSSAPVLITGESGTGKELLANAIHYASNRKQAILRAINIAAVPETLMESELFGHIKGSFTGAISDRSGVFEQSHKGTLFIDEIGEIPLPVQVKLLRTLQFGQIQKLGSEKLENCDVRIIAATNKNLNQMIDQGKFRKDLYYRLNVIHIDIPPLRERRDDIPPLLNHFVELYGKKNNKLIRGISHDAMDLLMRYDYPGNIREMENIIERALIFSRSDTIGVRDLPHLLDYGTQEIPPVQGSYKEKMESYEKILLRMALDQSEGNKSAAARELGISERRIRSRMKILKMEGNNG